jgi:Trk-type K+ transport system membrane component
LEVVSVNDFDDIRQKVMVWIHATGGLILGGLVFVILCPIILKFRFDFGNSGGAARWPFLKDIVLFTLLGLLVAGFWILIYKWWKRGQGNY